MKTNSFFLVLLCLVSSYVCSLTDRRARNTYRTELDRVNSCQFNICDAAPKYPANKVRRIVSQRPALHSFFEGDVFQTSVNNLLSQRSNSNLQYFCRTTDVRAAPRLMKDIADVARVIVNVDGYNQILNFQVCEQEGRQCFEETLLGYETKCEQKYNNIKLVTINVTNSILEYKTFKLPTTCVCTYKRTR